MKEYITPSVAVFSVDQTDLLTVVSGQSNDPWGKDPGFAGMITG